jgi:hypothetical protein
MLLMVFAITGPSDFNIGLGHLAINDCFIPVALLALHPRKKKHIVLGWIAIALMMALAARIWSRSYTLVAGYFALLGILAFFSTGKRRYGYALIIFLTVIYFSGALSILNEKSVVHQDSSVADKYQFSSLGKTLEQFGKDGDFVKLFFWEGNSRSQIILDAFGNFSNREWWLGRGIFGKYISFVDRSTIEIGWAQDLFRWGIPYILFTLFAILYARRRLRKGKAFRSDPMARLLAGLLLIKFLDGFIFGMPYNTLYNMFVFWGVMRIAVVYTPILKPTPAHGELPERNPETLDHPLQVS